MPEYCVIPTAALSATADAIKAKTGSAEDIEFTQDGFADAIETIPTSEITGYGDPYTMMMNSFGTYTVSGVADVLAWETYSTNSDNTRRCIASTTGDNAIKRRTGSSTYADADGLYPIEIPSGVSKLSLERDGSGQTIVFFVNYTNDNWLKVSDTGWVNFPVTNYSIPSGATHFVIDLRVNSSNSAFANTTVPKYVNITFS